MKIIKIPYGKGSLGHNEESRKAPDAIVEDLKNIWLKEDGKRPGSYEVHEIENTENIKEIEEELNEKQGDIYIGGDHSLTYPCFKTTAEKYPGMGLIVFDAHPDVFKEHDEVKHQDYLLYLIEEKILDPGKVIVIGIRNPDITEIDFYKKHKVKYYTAKQVYGNIENVCDNVMETARKWPALYISLDIDAVDPAFAPGTGYIEPAGMSSRELLYFIQRMKLLKNLKTVDMVEVNPDKDVNGMTVKLAAKIIGELL